MAATETLMAEEIDAIIRRLTKRIQAATEQPRRKGSSVKRLKKSLGRMRNIRSHFNDAN